VQVLLHPPAVIVTLNVYEPHVPELTWTEEPVALPTIEAPEVFEVNDQLKLGLLPLVVAV
jgi:hypothetical protein